MCFLYYAKFVRGILSVGWLHWAQTIRSTGCWLCLWRMRTTNALTTFVRSERAASAFTQLDNMMWLADDVFTANARWKLCRGSNECQSKQLNQAGKIQCAKKCDRENVANWKWCAIKMDPNRIYRILDSKSDPMPLYGVSTMKIFKILGSEFLKSLIF